MNFRAFREFRNSFNNTIKDVASYLSVDLPKTLRELDLGLRKLEFLDNFETFETTVTIPASTESAIPNELTPIIPTKWIQVSGDGYEIVNGDTAWSQNFVYLKNLNGSTARTVTVIFFK